MLSITWGLKGEKPGFSEKPGFFPRTIEVIPEKAGAFLALFHFQQAAEKALKAFLYAHTDDRRVFFTHSVLELVQAAAELDPTMEHLEEAGRLDQYYILTRYPNGLPGGVPSRFYTDPEEAAEASALANRVLEAVGERLKGDLTTR